MIVRSSLTRVHDMVRKRHGRARLPPSREPAKYSISDEYPVASGSAGASPSRSRPRRPCRAPRSRCQGSRTQFFESSEPPRPLPDCVGEQPRHKRFQVLTADDEVEFAKFPVFLAIFPPPHSFVRSSSRQFPMGRSRAADGHVAVPRNSRWPHSLRKTPPRRWPLLRHTGCFFCNRRCSQKCCRSFRLIGPLSNFENSKAGRTLCDSPPRGVSRFKL